LPNWGEVLQEISAEASGRPNAIDSIRRRYLERLFEATGRNVIAYYSGFLSRPGIQLLDINDEDMNGFMMAVHRLDRSKGLDLLLHTPGGSIAATESIVNYLQAMFKDDIRVIVPQIAMSAGTMIACCAKKIVMGKQSSLGPIDPHLRGIPAQGVIDEFRNALEEYKKDPDSLRVWQYIIQQYRPTFLGQCQQAIEWTKRFVGDQLQRVMFAGEANAQEKAARIVEALSDADEHKAHERHIPITKCMAFGLEVDALEDDHNMQDLVLTVHHCYMHTLMNSPAFKIIENHTGVAFIKAQMQR
jgi:ClpP class serine protease